jgi:glyoxylase-like metal-dependent hydrolase (beta-lactamase superfamily II)
MSFLTEPVPAHGDNLPLVAGITRIVANNPGPMTYRGTNTYLIDTADGYVVIDPGPEGHPEHVEAILRHTNGKVAGIVATHTHHDHVGAVPALKAATGAKTYGFTVSATDSFQADVKLADGDDYAGLVAVHTPGHASDHLSFAFTTADGEKMLFSGDHVMSWSTSIVSPPGGNMRHYFDSLSLLLNRDDAFYLCGHGPLLREPRNLVRAMLTHRQMREGAILEKVRAGLTGPRPIMEAIYGNLDDRLRPAAERNVLSHLLKLEVDGKAARDGDIWRLA